MWVQLTQVYFSTLYNLKYLVYVYVKYLYRINVLSSISAYDRPNREIQWVGNAIMLCEESEKILFTYDYFSYYSRRVLKICFDDIYMCCHC